MLRREIISKKSNIFRTWAVDTVFLVATTVVYIVPIRSY